MISKMPKLKTGEVISWKEALVRFKKGLESITPLQKLQNEIRGTFITLIGFMFSFIAIIIMRAKFGLLAYGLILIFLGSIITTGLRFLGLRQQVISLNDIETNSINVNDIFNKIEGNSTDDKEDEEVPNINEEEKNEIEGLVNGIE